MSNIIPQGLGVRGFRPSPFFSSNNPFWQKRLPNMDASIQKGPTAYDFLLATEWEINRWDYHGARLVRDAVVLTARLNTRIVRLKPKQEAVSNEKVT